MTVTLAALTMLCVGCTDLPSMPAPADPPAKLSQLIGCRVDVRENRTECEPLRAEGPTGGGASMQIVHDAQWMIETGEDSFTESDSTYRLNIRVINTTAQLIGTPDEVAVTGVKAFLPYRPIGYHGRIAGDTLNDPYGMLVPPMSSINNSVHARNPDGVQSFTAPDQPFWSYPESIQPWEASAWREWQFTLHPEVSYFYFSVSILAAVPGEVQAGLTAPKGYLIPADSVAQLFAPSNAAMGHPRMSGPYPRNIVQIGFKLTATRDERQAAIDRIGGRLIGGLGLGAYQVLIEDDGTAEPLWRAIDLLSQLPQVQLATPDIITLGIGAHYLLPNDGPGWRRSDWSLSRDSSDGPNWGAEAIAAPWAWGCETGSDTTKVAVVDWGIDHSEQVHSIIARPANDVTDMAGIMWKGRVSNTGAATTSALLDDLRDAFADSAAVINLSWGAQFQDTISPNTYIPRLAQDSPEDNAYAAGYAARFGHELHLLEVEYSWKPLYVIAAGNAQMEARLAGLPLLVEDPEMGNRVLVVGASTNAFVDSTSRVYWANSADPIRRGSNFGTLVEISAPGADVDVVSGGISYAAWGTSFAAPHVSGVAGLLKSFDPRLNSETLKALILVGAVAGGRTSGGYPHLDAFQALRAAARRPGAPLCDNRLGMQNGTLYAQRDTLSPTGEALFTVTTSDSRSVRFNALHGGKRVHLFASPSSNNTAREWRVVNGVSSWVTIPFESSPDSTNASFLSRAGKSHGADSAVVIVSTYTGPLDARKVEFTPRLSNAAGVVLETFPFVRDSVYEKPKVCRSTFVSVDAADHNNAVNSPDTTGARKYLEWREAVAVNPCTLLGDHSEIREVFSTVGYSPRFPEAYLLIHRRLGATVVESSFSCRIQKGFTTSVVVAYNAICRNTRLVTESAGTTIYKVDFPAVATVPLAWGEPLGQLSFPTLRENGIELTVQHDRNRIEVPRAWTAAGAYHTPVSPPTVQTRTCKSEFRDLATGTVKLNPITCRHDGGDAGFSADKRPSEGL